MAGGLPYPLSTGCKGVPQTATSLAPAPTVSTVKDTREGTSHQKMWQGVVFVTEPHAELNAGFVGLFASGHPAIFNWAQWNAETKHLNEREFEERCSHTAGILTSAYWTLVSQYLCRRLSSHDFFLSGCCMAQRRSLSGRSPFCQRKLSDSRKFNENFVP